MKKLLEAIQKYANINKEGSLSLVIEKDGSGCLIQNVHEISSNIPLFEFDDLEELEEELKIKNCL